MLQELALTVINQTKLEEKVATYWIPNTGWDWGRLENRIPSLVIKKLAGYQIVESDEATDGVDWVGEGSGTFSISLACKFIHDNARLFEDGSWERIWNIKAPNKMNMFI